MHETYTTASFQNFMFVFAASTLAIWNLRQYGQISNMFAFRIWEAEFEMLRFEIMKTDTMICTYDDYAYSSLWHLMHDATCCRYNEHNANTNTNATTNATDDKDDNELLMRTASGVVVVVVNELLI